MRRRGRILEHLVRRWALCLLVSTVAAVTWGLTDRLVRPVTETDAEPFTAGWVGGFAAAVLAERLGLLGRYRNPGEEE